MPLRFFVSSNKRNALRSTRAALTSLKNLKEAQAWTKEAGSDEKVVSFVSVDGDGADVIEALSILSDDIMEAIEKLVTEAFRADRKSVV
jgi:hypothetical protein